MATGLGAVIADDDPDIRLLLEMAAARAGFAVVGSHGDGRSALQDALDSDPALLLLDISMPELTGIEVTTAIRAALGGARPRIVLVSASVEETVRQAGRDAGADLVVAKPFRLKELAERLRTLLEEPS